jgi:hypothetical protein
MEGSDDGTGLYSSGFLRFIQVGFEEVVFLLHACKRVLDSVVPAAAMTSNQNIYHEPAAMSLYRVRP